MTTTKLRLNLGPQHPSTHGVLRLILELEGEKILSCEPDVGYLHRGMEKMAEKLNYIQYLPCVDRIDYLAGFFYSQLLCDIVEKEDIKEIKRPDKDAQLVAENIAQQLENRVSFRRAMKSAMNRTMKTGALGVKASCAGRLGGADIARTETYSDGTIPLQTLRADIDYGFAEADTTYGKVGVKVWIYKGEILPKKKNEQAVAASDESKGGDN